MPEPVIELRAGLSAEDLAAIAELERATVAADGGRLKLEWGVLNSRNPEVTNDVVCTLDGRLVGFLGIYAFGHEQVELAGMVDPSHRRQGIGSALLAAAMPIVAERGYAQALLVCSHLPAAAEFARSHGGEHDHAEHAMLLSGPPAAGPTNPAVSMRVATVEDVDVISRLLQAGFGYPATNIANELLEARAENLIIDLDGVPVGYVRITLEGNRGGVYGFVVDPVQQGRGIGRDVLRRCCERLTANGATEVGLEVAVENERALGLYTSIGFERVTTEEYFRLPSSLA